ncbi:MAG: hypothetical protein CVV52_14175 [Spirochaetae bacterium HGW-Spirochaetae-8]|nr:MAG: hypothetical protein CVV52_14175 [Spirochaetae bacterium HGW-Spirochaetae-8]
MKKRHPTGLIVIVLILLLAGCELSPQSKPLIVVNESDADITEVNIIEYIAGARRIYPNALTEGDSIAPGARRTFYLAPYSYANLNDSVGRVKLRIGEISIEFSFDFIVENHNERIIATYDGSGFTLTGSNVTPFIPQ